MTCQSLGDHDHGWIPKGDETTYTGYDYDYFAGLYYANARYYLPEIGRFILEDPWAGTMLVPNTLNPYPYVLNNPLRFIDPLGLSPRVGAFIQTEAALNFSGSGHY